MNYCKLDDSVCRGLDYLAANQRADGGFDSLRSIDVDYFDTDGSIYQTTFISSLIAGALENIKKATSSSIRTRIADYLLGQKDENWSFNYWDRSYETDKEAGIPNDLDDTFCALNVLNDIYPEIFDGNAMARIVTLLCANEIQPGGPYNTWNSNEVRWQDVDPVVNANISYFLQKHNVHLDGLATYLRDAVTQNLVSNYYSSKIVVYYFIVRAIPDIDTSTIRQFLLDELDDKRNSLEMALIISTLSRLDVPYETLAHYIEQLIDCQAADGSWPAGGLYVDARLRNGFEYSGCSELTTAFCIEAINSYEQMARRVPQTKSELFKDKLIARIHHEIAEIPSWEIRSNIHDSLGNVMAGSKERNVTELPIFMASAIKGYNQNPEIIEALSTMSLWGWIAYTLQDSCIDDMYEVDVVPVISLCMRKLSQNIETVTANNREFNLLAYQILDIQEGANTWELRNCRVDVLSEGQIELSKLPNYSDGYQLASRSLGHTISALGVMYAAGFTASSPEFGSIRKFFYHYLLARQLSDDAHDWEDDLEHGHINYVATGVLRYYVLQNPPRTSLMKIDDHINNLRKILWDYHIVEISELIITHIAQARNAVSEFADVFDIELLDSLLAPIESSAQKSLSDRQKALDFIKHLE